MIPVHQLNTEKLQRLQIKRTATGYVHLADPSCPIRDEKTNDVCRLNQSQKYEVFKFTNERYPENSLTDIYRMLRKENMLTDEKNLTLKREAFSEFWLGLNKKFSGGYKEEFRVNLLSYLNQNNGHIEMHLRDLWIALHGRCEFKKSTVRFISNVIKELEKDLKIKTYRKYDEKPLNIWLIKKESA